MDEKSTHFADARFSINVWTNKKLAQYNQHPLKNAVGYLIYFYSQCQWRKMHHCLSVFLVQFQPRIIIFPCRALFLFYLGTHPIKTGKEILYDHLYHEDAPFYMDVYTQLFNRHFIKILSLSLQQHIIIQHTLFYPFIQNYVNRQ